MQKDLLHIKKSVSRLVSLRHSLHGGFSLIEVIISSALILLLATLFTNAILVGQEGTSISGMRARANLVAEEGLEAVRNMRDSTFLNLVNGTYGVTAVNGTWGLVGTSSMVDMFTRNITIQSVDTVTKQITSTVTWQQNSLRTGSVSLVGYLIDTSLLVPQIKSLQIDVSGGHISASNRLVGVKIKNVGAVALTLSTTTASWVGGSQTHLTEVDINGGTRWASVGGYYPAGPQATGTPVGLTPIIMSPNSQTPINNYIFDGNIHGSTFTIGFTMSDNSSTTITLPLLP